jgi:hypothetical protein
LTFDDSKFAASEESESESALYLIMIKREMKRGAIGVGKSVKINPCVKVVEEKAVMRIMD